VRRPATIIEVAAEAGVSKSTVSNVIRGAPSIAAPTRDRVTAAIERLGYRPNVLARQLVQRRTTTIGVLVGDLSNSFYAEMVTRIERSAFRLGYTTMFCNVEGEDGQGVRGVETLLQHRVAGIMFLAFFGRSSAVRDVLANDLPVVFVGLRERWGDSVAVDDALGGRLATEHLLGRGHTRVAYVSTPTVERRTARGRYAGYRAAMEATGLDAAPAIDWNPRTGSARIAGRRTRLADLLPGRDAPSAVFCSSDAGAIALIELADRLGLHVPEDISVVGFDNVAIAGLSRIALTTVAQPLDILAHRGVETLLARLAGGLGARKRHLVVDPELVVRRSTAAPARRSHDG
jgi:DNA-binding LacI/PurR family transcriptional regulator